MPRDGGLAYSGYVLRASWRSPPLDCCAFAQIMCSGPCGRRRGAIHAGGEAGGGRGRRVWSGRGGFAGDGHGRIPGGDPSPARPRGGRCVRPGRSDRPAGRDPRRPGPRYQRRPVHHGRLREGLQGGLLRAGPDPAGVRSARAVRRGGDRPGHHDRHRRLLRLPDHPERPGCLRPRLPDSRPAPVPDHPARGAGARLRPGQLQHGRLGRRDHAGRGVGPRGRAGSEHPAGRDAGLGDRGRARLPADRHGRDSTCSATITST